nr:hypothetical protein BaRGS_011348 [Batillaria attramentaria]
MLCSVTFNCVWWTLGENCSYFLEKGGLKLLLRLLAHPTLDSASILKVTNAIGHAMEYTGDDGIELAQEEVGLLVHLLTETQDDEVVHAIKYILHSSRQHAGGLSTDEVRREQTGILSKVKDLSSKLGLPEDAVSVDDWWPGSLHSGDGIRVLAIVETRFCKMKGMELLSADKLTTIFSQTKACFQASK